MTGRPADPHSDQYRAATRDAAAIHAGYAEHVGADPACGPLVLTAAGPEPATATAAAALREGFGLWQAGERLACAHLHAQPSQPIWWLAYVPDRLACAGCAVELISTVGAGPERAGRCDRCGRLDGEDLAQVELVSGRVILRGYLCGRCRAG
jgi:hypothetical protein